MEELHTPIVLIALRMSTELKGATPTSLILMAYCAQCYFSPRYWEEELRRKKRGRKARLWVAICRGFWWGVILQGILMVLHVRSYKSSHSLVLLCCTCSYTVLGRTSALLSTTARAEWFSPQNYSAVCCHNCPHQRIFLLFCYH